MEAVYAHGDQWRHDFGPPGRLNSGDIDTLFSFQVYHGGALILYALRQKIGTRAFEQLEREWFRRNRDGVVRSADFVALASKVARRDLSRFLTAWIYGETTPAMPGHPDWTVDPVVEEVTARALSSAPRLRRR
jgi:aminopeptidase N